MRLERLARWSYHHRKRMLFLWIGALIGFNVLMSVAGGPYATSFSLPGSESQAAYDLLKERFPAVSGDTGEAVFKAEGGVDDPAVRSDVESMIDDLASLDTVESVTSPYESQGAPMISPDGTIAFARIQFDTQAGDVPLEVVEKMIEIGDTTERDGLEVALGGPALAQAEFKPPGGAEAVALLAAMLILLITFGSVLAMGLPIMTALFGIGIGLALVLLSANFLSVPNFTPQLASMIGIGVGIDYALFIVTRYRQGLSSGSEPEEAVVDAITTAGRAVLFAGTTVVISFLGILFMRFDFVEGVAVGGAATVLVTMVASVTLLPAVLGFVGRNIDRLKLPKFHKVERDHHESRWFKWSRLIQRRPAPIAALGLIVMIVLAIPLFSIRLGSADAGNNPEDANSRQAYDLLSEGFGPGFNGPLLLAVDTSDADPSALEPLIAELQGTEGVAAVSPPIPNEDGTAAIINVVPTTSPQDPATDELARHLRDDVIPGAIGGSGLEVHVGGITASFIDFAQQSGDRLPILIGVVIVLSFLLLMVVFRSILVPLKAAIMNLLSIGAAYGVIVAIFQWGWLKDVVGIDSTGPIEAWVPMMLFTILFGLSMDYEIFLLSRVREEYLRTGDNGLAVANGLAATARVITAAAAIMVAVFLSFVIGFELRQIKLFGMGLAVAIFVDATLIRMVLVPATMELLGDANWWLPKWLSKMLPAVHIERPDLEAEEPAPA